MNSFYYWPTIAVSAFVLAVSGVYDAGAQTRVRMEPRPAAGGAATGGGIIRLRDLTGVGPRGIVRTPVYSASVSGGRATARDWAELTVQFDSEPEWIDELAFQYFALLYNRTTREYTLLKGAATYVDVARGRGHVEVALELLGEPAVQR